MISKFVLALLGFVFLQSAQAATVEELTLEIGYHSSESITLKKIKGKQLEAYYLIKTFGKNKSKIVRIASKEFKRRQMGLVILNKSLNQSRKLASGCARYVRIQLSGKTDFSGGTRYCADQLSAQQNRAITRWWTGN